MGELFRMLSSPIFGTAVSYLDENGEKRKVSYERFSLDVKKCISLLSERIGSIRNAHIAVLGRTGYQYIVNLYAIIGSGAVFVPLNIEKSLDEIRHEIEHADVEYVIHDGEFGKQEETFYTEYGDRLISMDEYQNSETAQEWIERSPEELAMIMFTSGTTSGSKGVAVPLRAMEINAKAVGHFFAEVKERESFEELKCFFVLPLYHLYGISVATACISCGFEVSLCSDVRNMLREITVFESNVSAMVSMMLNFLSRSLKSGHPERLGKLKEILSAGAPCAPEIFDLFLRNGINVINHYGMTENGIGTLNVTDELYRKNHSAGRVFGDTQIAIEEGEVLLKGSSLMLGYYKNPKATAEVLRDGWFHTGDLGYLDDDGYLYLTGRKKNLIILSGGENVSPEELESLMAKNPAILEAIAKEKDGKICAEIYCARENREAISQYIEDLNRTLALYKQITLLEFRDEPFPKTGSGKIRRGQQGEEEK